MRIVVKSKNKQKGVALFVTLLVVAIGTLLATEIWFNNNLDISRQHNNRAAYQAKQYANGMVLWARDVLRQDYKEDASFDNHSETWNQTIAGIQLEDAVLSGKLIDLDSKFNLNNLFIEGMVNEINYRYFQRILNNLELDIGIADKVIDWIDGDQSPMPKGAEDAVYLSKSPSYRTAGQHLVHISELKLIAGIDQQTYQRLQSFVTVLPVKSNLPTTININTASSLLLKSLDNNISSNDAIMLYNDGNASNRTTEEFLNQRILAYHNLNIESIKSLISTRSIWYQAEINVKMEQSVFKRYALISRNSELATVKQWSQTPYN